MLYMAAHTYIRRHDCTRTETCLHAPQLCSVSEHRQPPKEEHALRRFRQLPPCLCMALSPALKMLAAQSGEGTYLF